MSRSLIRQLNAYSFQKVGTSKEVVFQHEAFHRTAPRLASMKRRKAQKRRPAEPSESSAASVVSSSMLPPPSPIPAASHAVGSAELTPSPAPMDQSTTRNALIAALGCIQEMSSQLRLLAVAAADSYSSPAVSAEALRPAVAAATAGSSAALRRFIDSQISALPPHLRRPMPTAVAAPGSGGSVTASGTLDDLDAAERAVASMMTAAATGQLGIPATPVTVTAASIAASFRTGLETDTLGMHQSYGGPMQALKRGEATFVAVDDPSVHQLASPRVTKVATAATRTITPSTGSVRYTGSSAGSVTSSVGELAGRGQSPIISDAASAATSLRMAMRAESRMSLATAVDMDEPKAAHPLEYHSAPSSSSSPSSYSAAHAAVGESGSATELQRAIALAYSSAASGPLASPSEMGHSDPLDIGEEQNDPLDDASLDGEMGLMDPAAL